MTNKIEHLQKLLANSYALYLKTQNYHWNVEGKDFYSLHKLFEEQYQDLFLAVDRIAERIRTLGAKAYGSFKKYSELMEIKEGNENLPAHNMIEELRSDQKLLINILNELIKINGSDEATLALLSERLETHEKNSWMLNSLLK